MTEPTVHVPVLLEEVIQWSGLSDRFAQRNAIVVDGTLGGGGHAVELLRRMKRGDTLLGIDRDTRAIERVNTLLEGHEVFVQRPDNAAPIERSRVHLFEGSYCDLPTILREGSLEKVDCILLDLGLSSDQLNDESRGFSFRLGGPLDLRYNDRSGVSARDLVNRADEKELADIIYQYGEERFSRRIARNIVERRRTKSIETAEELADLIHRSVPGRVHGRVDSATRTFQALRIAVNDELEHVRMAVERLPDCLNVGGRLIIISFHSLEDRIVKHAMRESAMLEVLTKKPIIASDAEIHRNPRSRSAKLRVAEKIDA